MNHSARRINALATGLSAQHYLEIGVDAGQTLCDVCIAERTAVDPHFRFDIGPFVNARTHFHEEPSDAYFADLKEDSVFDILFIDGLHVFEQVVRDFSNAVAHSHRSSVIVLDDTQPNDIYSAIPNVEEAFKFRALAGLSDRSWHGDVFKAVFYIHDFWPALNYRTIVGSGNPQTFIWRSNSFRRKPRFNSLEAISRLTYFQMIDNTDVFRACDEESAIKEVLKELLRQ